MLVFVQHSFEMSISSVVFRGAVCSCIITYVLFFFKGHLTLKWVNKPFVLQVVAYMKNPNYLGNHLRQKMMMRLVVAMDTRRSVTAIMEVMDITTAVKVEQVNLN